ncbi:carboxypeptidase-like regulatory domain-containing protein [Granulicella sp. dw_53]|uniref:TonB-dependent receptor n=1 Tax=Granulicella sp. dw_53 TaxID=2719792 RepID=UPI002108452B|nr:carboxypeptidase-like regulatory domain-containing protein [Granulicella sp. dw_53]
MFSIRKVCVFAVLGFASQVQAQVDTGAIAGSVTDSSGAVVPGAEVVLLEEKTGVTIKAQSGENGSFNFSPVKLGTYTLTISRDGYKQSVRQHIEVTIQSHLEINPKLEIGTISDTVQVSADSGLLETRSSAIQQLVTERAINDLPLNGRNPSFLAQLSPGVTFAQNDSRNLQASGSFTANGSRRTQNNYLLDGMDDNAAIADLVNQGQFVIMPPPDALREFTVQTSNYSAEFGHSAGAVLNVSTKSGTNGFHGNVWEYIRNDALDARDYFVLPTQRKPSFRQNQFGGTIGGPVIIPHVYNGRNHTFFFVDYQGTRTAQGKTYTKNVPTLSERNSGFTNLQDLIALQSGTRTDALGRIFPVGTVFDPSTTRPLSANGFDSVTGLTGTPGGFVRDPFYAGSLLGTTNFTSGSNRALLNQLPAGRLNANAVALLRLFPSPTGSALQNNYVVSPINRTTTDSFDTRFDETFNERDSLFVRYSFLNTTQVVPSPFAGVADGSASRPGNGNTQSQNIALSETHIFTPRLVNEARVGYSRVADTRRQVGAETLGIPAQFGIPGIPQLPSNGGLPLFEFGLLSNLGTPGTLPSDKASDIAQVTENLSIDLNRHQVRTGVEYQHVAFPTLTPTASRGDFTNNGLYTSIVANTDGSTDRAQFVLNPLPAAPGTLSGLGGSNAVSASSFSPVYHLVRQYLGAYVQDSWKAASNLTLNFGVRWEFLGIPTETSGRFANVVPAQTGTTSDGISRFYIPQSQAGNVPAAFRTQLAADGIVFTPTPGNTLGIAQKTNFAPRVGFSLQAKPRLVVRGGYGIFFQANENHGLSISPWVNYPFQISTSYTAGSSVAPVTTDNSVGPISNGLLNVPLTAATAAINSISLFGEARNPKTSYSQGYNLQVQYQVTSGTVAFVGYVGSNSRHLQTAIGANAVSSILPPTANTKANSFFKDFATGGTFVARAGQTNYNSLQAGFEHRFRHGLSIIANVTYSKCLGDARDLLDNGIGGYRAPYLPGFGINADYALCDIDVRRIVHTSGSYELPFGKDKRFVHSGVGALLAGGWSANWIFTAQDGQPFSVPCTTTTAAGLGCFALKVAGQSPYAGSHNAQQFLNPAAFANPVVGSLGGPPTQVTGPPFRRLDFSVFRRFRFSETNYFEFRAESFNLTNTPNFAQPLSSSLNFTSPSTFAPINATRDNPNDPRQIQGSLKYYF